MKRSLRKTVAFVLAIALCTASLIPITANAAISTSNETAISKTKSSAIVIPAQYDDVAVWDYGALVFEKGKIYTSLGKDSKVYIIDTAGNKRSIKNVVQGNEVGIAKRRYSSISKDYYQITNLQYGVMIEKNGKYGFYNNQNKLMHNKFYKNIIPTQGGYILTESNKTSIYDTSGKLIKTYSKEQLQENTIVNIKVLGSQFLVYVGNMETWWDGKLYDIVNENGKSLPIPGNDFSQVEISNSYNYDGNYVYYAPEREKKVFSLFVNEKEIVKQEPGFIIGNADDIAWGSKVYYNTVTEKYGVVSTNGILLKPEYDSIVYCDDKKAVVKQGDTVSAVYYDGKTKAAMSQKQLEKMDYASISGSSYSTYKVVRMKQ